MRWSNFDSVVLAELRGKAGGGEACSGQANCGKLGWSEIFIRGYPGERGLAFLLD